MAPPQPLREYYFRSTTRAPRFTCFTALPVELQMQIWKEAASPDGSFDVEGVFLLYHMPEATDKPLTVKYFFRRTSRKGKIWQRRSHDEIEGTCQARTHLMATSRFSRQVALEDWKKDLEALTPNSSCNRFWPCPCLVKKREQRVILLEVIDNLMEAAKMGTTYNV